MNLGRIKPGDVVKVDKRGREFFAIVTTAEKGALALQPVTPGITYRIAIAREIVAHYKKMGRPR